MNVTQLRLALRGLAGTTKITLKVDMTSEESEPLMLSIAEVESSEGCVLRLLNDDEDALADKANQVDEAIISLEKLQEHKPEIEKMVRDSYTLQEQVANIGHLYDEITNVRRRVADLTGMAITALPNEVTKIRRRLLDMSSMAREWNGIYDRFSKLHGKMYLCQDLVNEIKNIVVELSDDTPPQAELPQEVDEDYNPAEEEEVDIRF